MCLTGQTAYRDVSSRLSSAEKDERIIECAWVIGESKGGTNKTPSVSLTQGLEALLFEEKFSVTATR